MNNVPNPSSIKFVSTSELVNELADRFDCAMFIGTHMETKTSAGLGWHAKGDYFALQGMCQWLCNRIDEMEPSDPHTNYEQL